MSRQTIDLAAEWTFRTPLRTCTYPKGKHVVDEEVHKAAVDAGVIKEKADGDGTAKAGAPGASGPAQG